MPSLFSLILISGGFVLIFLDKEWALKTYQGIWLTLSFASNWLYALEYFSMENPLGITWSLAIEGQFYLVWPVILSLALRIKLRRCWILYILALSIAIIPLHRKILVEQGASVFRLYYGSDTRADALLIGCLVSFLVLWNLLPDNKGVKILLKSLALVAVIFLGYMVGTASWDDLMLYHRGGYTLVALSIGTILTVLIVWPPKVALLILKSAPLVWIGRISYGLYLWHWPVRAFIRNMNGPSGAQKIVAVVILSLMLPALSYYLIEKPFLRRKKRFHSI
jgi:peptidoglycan/LPS O-acetylase OafA/YrhL